MARGFFSTTKYHRRFLQNWSKKLTLFGEVELRCHTRLEDHQLSLFRSRREVLHTNGWRQSSSCKRAKGDEWRWDSTRHTYHRPIFREKLEYEREIGEKIRRHFYAVLLLWWWWWLGCREVVKAKSFCINFTKVLCKQQPGITAGGGGSREHQQRFTIARKL